jgi:hypothetical protein
MPSETSRDAERNIWRSLFGPPGLRFEPSTLPDFGTEVFVVLKLLRYRCTSLLQSFLPSFLPNSFLTRCSIPHFPSHPIPTPELAYLDESNEDLYRLTQDFFPDELLLSVTLSSNKLGGGNSGGGGGGGVGASNAESSNLVSDNTTSSSISFGSVDSMSTSDISSSNNTNNTIINALTAAALWFSLPPPSATPYSVSAGPTFLEISVGGAHRGNVTIIAVRGTDVGMLQDFMENVKLYAEPVIFSILSHIFPTIRMWHLPTTSAVIRALNECNTFFGLQEEAQYYHPLVERVNELARNGRNVIITGHSLGGGLARIVGSLTETPSVSFNPPGLALVSNCYFNILLYSVFKLFDPALRVLPARTGAGMIFDLKSVIMLKISQLLNSSDCAQFCPSSFYLIPFLFYSTLLYSNHIISYHISILIISYRC